MAAPQAMRPGGGGERALEAVVGRRRGRRCRRTRPRSAPRNALRLVPTSTGQAGGDQLVEVGEQGAGCGRRSCRSRCPGRSRPRRRRRPSARSARATRKSPHLGDHVVVARARACMVRGLALHVHGDPRRRRSSAATSSSEAETSLRGWRRPPTAARATAALRVSTDTRTPAPASASITGQDPAQLVGLGRPARRRAGWTRRRRRPVGALGDQLAAVGDRARRGRRSGRRRRTSRG